MSARGAFRGQAVRLNGCYNLDASSMFPFFTALLLGQAVFRRQCSPQWLKRKHLCLRTILLCFSFLRYPLKIFRRCIGARLSYTYFHAIDTSGQLWRHHLCQECWYAIIPMQFSVNSEKRVIEKGKLFCQCGPNRNILSLHEKKNREEDLKDTSSGGKKASLMAGGTAMCSR